MSILVSIKNEETANGEAVLIHLSNDSATKLLKEGESVEIQLVPGMCVNLIESEEDYSHGEASGKLESIPDMSSEFKGE